MGRVFYSHYRPEDEKYQTNLEHERSVASLSEDYCHIILLKKIVRLIGLYHDEGKNTESWQEYFQAAIRKEEKYGEGKEDHSTLGGLIIDQYAPESRFSEMAQAAIYMHHGLTDCISLTDGSVLFQRRKQKYHIGEIQKALERAQNEFQEDIAALCLEAKRDINRLLKRIQQLSMDGSGKYVFGSPDFYVGMCERMLLSCLMDADWRNTADFMAGRVTTTGLSDEEILTFWDKGIWNIEKKIAGFELKDRIDFYRTKISEQCKTAAFTEHSLYQLAVPTGAGKTLSSLRFALHCAKEHRKRHIFYIAPFKSILDQNAEVIRETLGMPEMVLEHHSDVVQESDEQTWHYERLIENWDESPVIVTTATQFLNTLFKEKRSNVRRFHSLCDSVVIVDEAQALPVRVIGLFNMAVNFLTRICNTTVVLCTATQPLFAEVRENRMFPSVRMTDTLSELEEAFRRVEYHDCTADCAGGFSAEQAAEFVLEKAKRYEQVLLILNTKSSAKKIYEQLEGKVEGRLFHLSTSMCAQHRSDKLEEIRKALADGERVICISTQLVEAGVDFSFKCVIRSLAGLDNLIQAAGRCNRNGKLEMGHVYLIRMSQEIENISSLPDIKKAQDAMMRFLHVYHKRPEEFGFRVDSEKAIGAYYTYYFYDRQAEMCYRVDVDGIKTSIVEMLSSNKEVAGNRKDVKLRQAFRSAGKAFEVIEEKGGTDVVVLYGEAERLVSELKGTEDPSGKRKILRKLQCYTVNLSDSMLRKLGSDAVYGIEDNKVLILEERYYDRNVGVLAEPAKMPLLFS